MKMALGRVQLLGEGLLASLFLGKRALPWWDTAAQGFSATVVLLLNDPCQKCAAPNKRWDLPSAKLKKQINTGRGLVLDGKAL